MLTHSQDCQLQQRRQPAIHLLPQWRHIGQGRQRQLLPRCRNWTRQWSQDEDLAGEFLVLSPSHSLRLLIARLTAPSSVLKDVPGVSADVRFQCYSGLAAQTWNYGSDNHIKLASANQCLDLTDGNKNPGNQVQIWEVSLLEISMLAGGR